MKDPAFLFYSNDFYSGTRTMLPEERACYIDLLIYQHQNGMIPLDLKRVLLFCSGVDKATLEATLEAKFERRDKGWVNVKLEKVIQERKNYKNTQSLNGTIGAFWKKIKALKTKKELQQLRQIFEKYFDKSTLYDLILKEEKDPSRVALAMLQHKENEIEIENGIETKDENEKENEAIHQVVDFLNQTVNRKFQTSSTTKQLLRARLNDYTAAHLKKVIELKAMEWMGTTNQRYLRPQTLFKKSNFEKYLEEVELYEAQPQAKQQFLDALKHKFNHDQNDPQHIVSSEQAERVMRALSQEGLR